MAINRMIAIGLAAVTFVSCGIAFGQDAQPSARFFKTEVVSTQPQGITVRGGFDITSPPHRWYEVRFQAMLDAQTMLMFPEHRPFILSWGMLFMPSNVPTARWTDCQLQIKKEYFETAVNLPAGKRSVVFISCEIWDCKDKKYLGYGWNTRVPLIVTTDSVGKVTSLDTFNADQFILRTPHQSDTMEVCRTQLETSHLKLRTDAATGKTSQTFRAIGSNGAIYDVATINDYMADIRGMSRGYFFDPIDTQEKATELIKLGYPGAVIIRDQTQYDAILSSLRPLGWKDGVEIIVDKPSTFGLVVREEPGLGYRATMLSMDYIGHRGLCDVRLREICVGTDGTIGVTSKLCVRGPESEAGRPAGWTQPLPAGVRKYNDAVNAAITAQNAERVARMIAVTDQVATIPCDNRSNAGWFLKVADWPPSAKGMTPSPSTMPSPTTSPSTTTMPTTMPAELPSSATDVTPPTIPDATTPAPTTP